MSTWGDRLRGLWAHGGGSMGLFALAAGVLAAWSMQHYLVNRIANIQASTQPQTTVRLVAAYDLAGGEAITEDSVATQAVPLQWAGSEGLAPEHFVTWEGSVLIHGLQAGEQILATNLRAPEPRSLASTLTPGRRAVTISLDDPSVQTGVLRRGNSVDIYVTHDDGGQTQTHLLLQGMRVLAVGSHSDEEGEADVAREASIITLDASLPEAARLVAARQRGQLGAVLRSDRGERPTDSLVALPRDLQIALGLIARPKAVMRRRVPVLYGTEDVSHGVDMSKDLDASEAFGW